MDSQDQQPDSENAPIEPSEAANTPQTEAKIEAADSGEAQKAPSSSLHPIVVPRLRAVGWIIRGKHCFDAEWEEGGKIVRTEDTYPTAKAARDAATAGWLARHNS